MSQQVHQSLLMHENRQLEDALYVARAQVADLRRENDWLREHEFSESSKRSQSGAWDDDFERIQPFEMPKVILPSDSDSTEVPELLRGSQTIHIWSPRR